MRAAALVIGGTGRIGRAVVEAVAGGGHDVAVHCHASLPAARDLAARIGGASLAVTADLREEAAVRALVHRVADHFGRLDAVVLCARRRTAVPLDEASAADLRTHFDVNVVGGFVVAQEAGAVMAGQEDGGAIVFVRDPPDVAAVADDLPHLTSRGAIPALARAVAAAFAGHAAIRVACVTATTPAETAAAVLRAVMPPASAGGA